VYSTNYIVIFILILTATVAVALTGLRQVTKSKADLNEEIFEKRAILSAVEDHLPDGQKVKQLSDQQVLNIFSNIEQVTLDMSGNPVEDVMAEDIDMAKERKKPESERLLPLFIFEQGGEKYYIVSVRGNGLWDEIWGNIALESDLNTITGAAFDHQGETPGLGAEIKDNPNFAERFKGKKIYDDGEYVSVTVRKGGAKDPEHEVDGISGATVTANGVTEMLHRGIKYYQPYFQTLKRS
jgi:Na+-transporting NADH:ubiquinone oxidoreductase subunit C